MTSEDLWSFDVNYALQSFAQFITTSSTVSLPALTESAALAPKLMSSFDDSFSSFVDHYILLLAARFKAPIHTWSGGNTAQVKYLEDPASHAWVLVSKCVQEVMSSTSTQTPYERQQLKHIDVGFFTPRVCRERAMYLQWKIHKAEAKRQERKKVKPEDPTAATSDPSSFDVTKDSLQNDVAALFASVRKSLPSAALDPSSSSSEEDDGDVEIVDIDERRKKKGENVSAFHLRASKIVDVPMRSDEQVRRDGEIARARDAMLTRVQEMQTEFFNQYRRWVDVPVELMDAPPTGHTPSTSTIKAGANGQTCHLPSQSNSREPSQATSGSGAVPSDAAEMMMELKRRMHVNRPSRPSAVTDEGIEAMYATSLPTTSSVPSASRGTPSRAAAPAGLPASILPESWSPRGASVGSLPMPPASKAPPQNFRGTTGLPSTDHSNNVHKVTKETEAPVVAGRRGRLQILEYDD